MEGTLGEVIPWAPTFAPRSWAFCQGQILSINSNQALFSLLGTTYGGDGRTTFALPDLRGRVAMGEGDGPATSNRTLGSRGGQDQVALAVSQVPSHVHTATASGTPVIPAVSDPGTTHLPAAGLSLAAGDFLANPVELYSDGAADTTLGGLMGGAATLANAGGGVPHENRDPYLGLNYIICVAGLFPSRN